MKPQRTAHRSANALGLATAGIVLAAALIAAVLIPGQILAAHRAAVAPVSSPAPR